MTIKNLPAFDRWIKQQVTKLENEQVPLFVKRIGLEVFRRVILKSPVGNPALWKNPASAPPGYVGGRYRSNWQIGNMRNSKVIDETNRNAGGGDAMAVLNLSSVGLDTTVWIFNNVSYGPRIERGWSGQAPAGVLGVTLLEITQASIA